MISFCQPCLQWKLFLAYKTHWGFPGLLAAPAPGYATRYLAKSVRLQQLLVVNGATGVIADDTDVNTIDRITGALTTPPNGQTFPDPTFNITTDPRWTITSDSTATFYQAPTAIDPISTQYDVTLSNQYTLEQLEADVDALMGTIDPSTVPPMNLKQVYYPGDTTNFFLDAENDAHAAIPGAYLYDAFGQTLSFQSALKAAAFTAYIPAPGVLVHITANPGLVKLASLVAMAGDYCLKTFVVDYQQNPVGTPQCVSGVGTCNGWFGVSAPPLAPGVNTYKLVVPNCRCGG